jgi:hypothetical protein
MSVSEDTSPELGGDLDVNGFSIVSSAGGDIAITPDGAGEIILDGEHWPIADGAPGQVLKTDGATNLSWQDDLQGIGAVVDDLTPQLGGDLDVNGHSIVSVAGGNIAITPNGAGQVVLDGEHWPIADGTVGQCLVTDGATNLSFSTRLANVVEDTTPQLGGNLDVNGRSIVSIAGGDIAITPDGAGQVVLDGERWPIVDGTPGQMITTDGGGNLGWTTPNAGNTFDTYDFVVAGANVKLREASAVYFVGKWGNDAADGLTIESAKLTLQAAVTAAPTGSTILLHPGTYTETTTHAASNIMIKGMGFRTNIIITQADAAHVININAQTSILYQDVTIQMTAATVNNRSTILCSTGNAEFRQCAVRMVCAANIANARQPSVAEITAAGTITFRRGTIDYLHTGNGGATAIKSGLLVGNGSVFEFSDVRQVTVTNSGTALISTMCYDQSNTGRFNVRGCNIAVTDPNATSVIGFGFTGNAAIVNEYFKNVIIVTGSGANNAYAAQCADVASTTRFAHNRINVTGGAANYSYNVGAGATVVSMYDVVVAASGKTGAGTFTCCYSPSNGTETISTGLILQSSTAKSLLLGQGTAAVSSLGAATNGQLPIGNTGNNPTLATLTGAGGTSVTNGAGSITITGTNCIVTPYNASNTHTFNSATKFVDAYIWGGGGGGGSGRRADAGSARSGGGGGSGGSCVTLEFPMSVLSSPAVITIGSGGTGGAAQTVNNTDGIDGTNNVGYSDIASKLYNPTSATTAMVGKKGTTTTGAGGSGLNSLVLGTVNEAVGSSGGAGNLTAGSSVTATRFTLSAGSGAGGGGITIADAASNGGTGGGKTDARSTGPAMLVAGGAPGTAGGAGGDGNTGIANWMLGGGSGGGGGASSKTAAAGAGGAGGWPAGGGGGGGASLSGFNSGKGGDGSAGGIIIVEYL